jgi:hypothetical protein
MENRKEFMLVFRYQPITNYQPSEAELAEMHQSWGKFIGKEMSNFSSGRQGRGSFNSTHVIKN